MSELMRIKWVSQIPNFTSFSGIIYQNGKSTLVHQSLFYFTNKIIYFRFLEIVVQEVLIINFRCHVFLKRTLVTVSGYESIQFITYVIGPPRYHLSEGRYRRGVLQCINCNPSPILYKISYLGLASISSGNKNKKSVCLHTNH